MSTTYLAPEISALANTDISISSNVDTLLSYRNSDGGWGGYIKYPSSTFHTALALQALKAANYSDTTLIGQSLNYLIANQNADGGWGFYPSTSSGQAGAPSNIYITAIVSAALQQFTQTTALATAINKATSYLLAYQNTDGGFGNSPSKVYETALAFKALFGVTTDATILGRAVNYLTATQAGDGSWNDDPYSTALALQALALSETRPVTPPSVPTTATVSGTVVDASTNQPLQSVSVILASNGAIAALTNSAGAFSLANVPQGSQQITFTLSGYATSTATVAATAGSIINIGSIGLAVIPTSGIIQGVVTASANGAPLSGVTITITGASTWTATTSSDGTYKITNIAPGNITISASKSGYTTVSAVSMVTAGETLSFSPSLTITPPPATTGALRGKVIDSATGLPLQGATISVAGATGYTASTDSTGNFALSSINIGSYVVSVSAAGYGALTYSVFVIADVTTDMGSIALTLNPTTGTVQGTVTDLSTGAPIAGVAITISGASTWPAVTIADGSYKLEGLTPGAVTLSAAREGYGTVSGGGTVVAGGTLIFNVSLTSTPPVTTGGVKGVCVDASTRQPISGTIVTLTPTPSGPEVTATSDATGAFVVSSVTSGNYTSSITAAGYISQTSALTIVANVASNVGTIQLTPAPTATTITGTVTDAKSGAALPNVEVTIVGTTLKTKTSSDGAYTITNITTLTFTIKASLTGYDSFNAATSTAGYGLYTGNISLSPSKVSTLRIQTVQTDNASYSANADVAITGTIENFGDTTVDTLISAEISDSTGNIIAIASPAGPIITLASGETSTVSLTWNTNQAGAGDYTITLKAKDTATVAYGTPPAVLAELPTKLTITAFSAISGALSLSPPVTQANMQMPVAVTTAIRNTGNVPVTTTMRLEAALNGSVVYTRDVPVSDLPVNNVSQLDLGSFTPGSGGNYTVTLKPVDTSIVSNITTTLYVGPYATATFTATPARVQAGSATLAGKISLTGIASAGGTVQDPLVPLVLDAIQKGVNWEQTTAMSWQNTNTCYGCHVQAQTLIGSELSRDKVSVNSNISRLLLDYMKTCQSTAGYATYYPANTYSPYPVEATSLFAWSLSFYHDATKIQDPLTRALDYLITKQNASGYWVSDYYYGANDWWNDLGQNQPSTPFTAYNTIAAAKAYTLTGLQKYKDVVLKTVNYMKGADHTRSIVTAAHLVIGLKAADGLIDDPAVQAAADAKVAAAIAYLRGQQNADGGWGRYAGTVSDPLPTAHVLYAMSRAAVPSNDQCLRNGTTYLLNRQNADGTWSTAFIRGATVPDRYFGATTWAIISLPAALDTIAGVGAQLAVVFPSNVTPGNITPAPTSVAASGSDATYTWNFSGLLQQATDILMDLTLTGLQPREQRSIAQDAELSFTDSYTGQTITLPIDIPVVNVLDSASIGVTTDKGQYPANENVQIATAIMNNSSLAKSIAVRLTIEDQIGTVISEVPTSTATLLDPNYFPGWAYRVPVPVTAARDMKNSVAGVTVDFAQELRVLGVSNKTVDKNSIRVLERDAAGSVIGEKQAQAIFTSGTNALITWVLDGTTVQGTTRYFLLYFDITDNGPKPSSLNTKFPSTGKLIAYSNTAGNIYVVESNGDGTFGAARFVDDVSSSAGDYTWGVAVDDFNNDGFADIVTGSGANGEIYYYQNKADGTNTFKAKVKIGSITSNGYIMSIAAGDFNHDGNKDFVVSGNNTILYLFLSKGDGSFKQSTLMSPSGESYLRAKFAVDVDRDGKLDLLVSGCCSGGLYFYKGNGDGIFQAPVLLNKLGRDSYGLAVGDFNEDGALDVLRSSDYAGATYLYKGNGDGTFGAGTFIPSLNPGTTSGYAAGDFNNDGHADVIAANATQTVEFYPGRGDGSFGPKTTIATATGVSQGVSVSPPMPEVFPALGVPETVPPQMFSFTWNTGQTYAGLYQIHAVLSDQTGTLSEARASFAILPDMAASAKVVTDKAAYNPNETATISSTITNLSANYVMEGLTARLSIQNTVDSTQVYNETKTITTLMPGAAFTFKSYWNTGTNAPGAYPVLLEVKDASGTVIATGTRELVISSAIKPSVALKGLISVDKQGLLSGETVTLSYSVTNVGNVALADIGLSIKTVHVVNQTVYDTLVSQASLSINGTYTGLGAIDTTKYSAKDYLVVLQANINGTTETLAGAYFRVEGAPSAPSLAAPAMGSDVLVSMPTLSVNNASDPNDDQLTYEFEVYADSGMTQLASSGVGSEESGVTSWTIPVTLTENQTYYWRARAYDNWLYGPWMEPASFRVNTVNDPPTAPLISSPADGSQVATFTPVLVVTNATDPDSPSLTYNYDLALDPDFITIVTSTTGVSQGPGTTFWQTPGLTENTWYYWRSQADDWLDVGPWSPTAKFFVNTTNEAPTRPVIISPADGATIPALSTDITISNSTDLDSPVITYSFEVDTVNSFDTSSIIRSGIIPSGQGTTTWQATGLSDNTTYFVRAKASDGSAESDWTQQTVSFFVNTANDAPTEPTLANPSNGAGVNTFTPILSVHNSTDPDKNVLTYEFELYADADLTTLVTSTTGVIETAQITSWTVPMALTENQTYYWQSRAFDGKLYSPWMPQASFMVNTANDAPGAPTLSSPLDGSTVATLTPTLAINNALDPDSPSLTYDFEVYNAATLVASELGVGSSESGVTSWTMTPPLTDNTVYQWRARANDGDRTGEWMAMATFTTHVAQASIHVDIEFEPETLNKNSHGTWVKVEIELPHGYHARDVDISSIRLEGTVPAVPWPYHIKDHHHDHGCEHDHHGHSHSELTVKFKRSDVIAVLPEGRHVPVHVTGKVGNLTFEGVDIIRVMR